MKRNAAALLVLMAASGACWAGTTGTEFQELYELVVGWAQGYLGRSISVIFLLVGLGVGVLRGSIIGAIACLAAAMSLLIAPSVIEGILTALV